MLRNGAILLLLGLTLMTAASASEHDAYRLQGEPRQGGLLVGWAEPGAEVRQDGQTVRVGGDGVFLLGFGRDAGPRSLLEVRLQDGTTIRRELEVAQREYDIQRIDGLEPAKVTPPKEVLDRIAREGALVATARTRDDARADFLAGFVWPARGRISGVYGSQRILNGNPRSPHSGVDVAGATGTPIVAPAGGVVTLAEMDLYYSGGTVILDHGHGLSSTFIHMSRVEVEVGQRLEQGDKVGEIGATGRATGPHLHWAVNLFKTRLDPQLLAGPMPETQIESARADGAARGAGL